MDELMHDGDFRRYAKRKFDDIQKAKAQTGRHKKNKKGKQQGKGVKWW